LTLDTIKKDMRFLYGKMEPRLSKYRRNFNVYANNGRRQEDMREQYGNPLTYYNAWSGEDTGVPPSENIARAAVDTHVSKLSQTKVRPFFNPLVGTWKTRKVCRAAQVYFDEFFEMERVYHKADQVQIFADVFEAGVLRVNEIDGTIDLVAPWEYVYDAAEYNFGKLTRCFLHRRQYPLIYLKDTLDANKKKFTDCADILERLEEDRTWKGVYEVYYDLYGTCRYEFVNGHQISEEEIDFDVSPFVMLWRTEPLKGSQSTSMVDTVLPTQRQIDVLDERIHLAIELTPANTIWLPKGGGVPSTMLENEIGKVYEYLPIPGVTDPVKFLTPPAIDPSYINLLEYFKKAVFENEGISQLSAQAKKPSGLNSGVALQTVEDVESERHNVSLQMRIDFFMRLAKTCIEVFPEDKEILPKRSGRASVTWKDIKQEREMFNIQFSASSALSKDPKTKMEQIEKLLAMRIIDPGMVSSFLELPDLEGIESIDSASFDYCYHVVERAVEENEFDFYEVANLTQLFQIAANTLMRLDANEEDRETLDRLKTLLDKVKAQIDGVNIELNPPPPTLPEEMKPPLAPGPTNPLPLQPGPPPGPVGPEGNGSGTTALPPAAPLPPSAPIEPPPAAPMVVDVNQAPSPPVALTVNIKMPEGTVETSDIIRGPDGSISKVVKHKQMNGTPDVSVEPTEPPAPIVPPTPGTPAPEEK
jgi:hypothetical protein